MRRLLLIFLAVAALGLRGAQASDAVPVGMGGEVASFDGRNLGLPGPGGKASTVELAPDWLAFEAEPIGRRSIMPGDVVAVAAEELGPPGFRGLASNWFLVAGPEIPPERRRDTVAGLIAPEPDERILVGEFLELRYDMVLAIAAGAELVGVKLGPEARGARVHPVERDRVRVGARVLVRSVAGRTSSVLLLPGATR